MIIGFNNKMKKEYCFKQAPRLSLGVSDQENRYSYGSSKMGKDSWTDFRVEQIKRKYDTPSHRKNLSHTSNNDRSRDAINDTNITSPVLRDSTAFDPNRIESNSFKRSQEQFSSKYRRREQEDSYMPSFNAQSKENKIIEKFAHIKSCLKNEFSKNHSKQISNYRDYPQTKIDPRVQNIDKINSKIKKILDCLHENDKISKKERPEFNNTFLKGSVVSRENNSQKEQLEETKILSRQQVAGRDFHLKNSLLQGEQNDLSFSPKNKEKFTYESKPKKGSVSYFKQKVDSQYNSPYKKLQQGKSSHNSWFQSKPDHNRARSCLGQFKDEDYRLSSGKKIDDEITRTANRIKALEEQKRKLNIEFKPFHIEIRANRSTSNLAAKSYRNSKPPLPNLRMKTSEFNGRNNYRRQQQKSKTQIDQNIGEEFPQKRSSVFIDSDFKKIELPRPNTDNIFITEKSNISDSSNERSARFAGEISKQSSEKSTLREEGFKEEQSGYNNQMKLHAEEGIQNRKRKLLETATETFARETKRLIESLFEQVKLDEEFRNSKIWLRDSFKAGKWEELEKVINKFGCSQNQESLHRMFEVSEEEDNPFFSNREGEINYETLVEAWRRAETHWSSQIAHQFNLREFEVEKFSCEKVDMQKKGYFTVEDLVRFLNMETGTFYRNRDLILIFKRFTSATKLQWEDFMKVLNKQNQ